MVKPCNYLCVIGSILSALNRPVRLYLLSLCSFHCEGMTVGGQGQIDVHIYFEVHPAISLSYFVNLFARSFNCGMLLLKLLLHTPSTNPPKLAIEDLNISHISLLTTHE